MKFYNTVNSTIRLAHQPLEVLILYHDELQFLINQTCCYVKEIK